MHISFAHACCPQPVATSTEARLFEHNNVTSQTIHNSVTFGVLNNVGCFEAKAEGVRAGELTQISWLQTHLSTPSSHSRRAEKVYNQL